METATARKGGLIGGFVPYGYDYVPRDGDSLAFLEIRETQAQNVREMFRWLVEEKSHHQYHIFLAVR